MPNVSITKAITCAGCGEEEMPDAVVRLEVGDVPISRKANGMQCSAMLRDLRILLVAYAADPEMCAAFERLAKVCAEHMDWVVEVAE